ncbi:GRP family sugar transporter [Spirochaeta cellobiosiphila]|uniref:GRP family sugar transporter n=1 Tax=Spirochaeta cellobiosiphila TaxID=504483 RepID=UPI000406E1E9|nr:GRP family sugar transporter [Spirochaeta cellobiosiphila]
MLTFVAIIVTAIAWGIWVPLTHKVKFPSSYTRVFYVAIANLILAFFVARFSPYWAELTPRVMIFSFIGGIIWAISGACAFYASERIGIAKANGTWAPLNIVFSITWGILLFGEFLDLPTPIKLLALLAVIIIIAGILMIITASGGKATKSMNSFLPYLAAIGTGVLWGTYFIPIRLTQASTWAAAFPLGIGILVGSLIFVIISRSSLKLEKTKDYAITMTSGLLWGIGNYSSLILMERIGTGKGYTIAQISLVINALISIFIFHQPSPKTKEALKTVIGILVALAGAIILGNLK